MPRSSLLLLAASALAAPADDGSSARCTLPDGCPPVNGSQWVGVVSSGSLGPVPSLLLIGTRKPALALWLQRAIDAIAAIFMSLVVYAIWPEFLKMWESSDYFGVPGVFTAPWWPIKLVILASGALCALLFIIKFVNASPDTPVGIADAAEDAAS